MNLIIKRYKILIISFSMFFLTFNCFKPMPVHAVAIVDDVAIVGGVTVSSSAIIALCASTLIATGAVIDTYSDGYISKHIASSLISGGEAARHLSIKILDTGQQVLRWTSEGYTWFGNTVSSFIDSFGKVNVPSIGSTYPVNVLDSPGLTIPNGFERIYNIGSVDASVGIIGFYYVATLSRYDMGSFANTIGDITGSLRVLIKKRDNATVTSVIQMLKDGLWTDISSRVIYSISEFPLGVSVGTKLGQSICAPMSDVFSDSLNSVDSSSVLDRTGSLGIPLSGDDVLAPSFPLDINNTPGLTWDDIKDKVSNPDIDIPLNPDVDTDTDIPSDTTGDITADGDNWVLNIPILGDILKVLLKILELLKTFVKTLIDALVSAITTLFVPSDTYFTDKFDGYRTTLIGKLGDNNFDFLQQSGSNIEDIYINIFGQQVCIVKITLFNKFKDFAFIVIRAFFYFFLILFNFNQVIKFLRGSIFSDYNSRESMAILQNNDNLDKIINNV